MSSIHRDSQLWLHALLAGCLGSYPHAWRVLWACKNRRTCSWHRDWVSTRGEGNQLYRITTLILTNYLDRHLSQKLDSYEVWLQSIRASSKEKQTRMRRRSQHVAWVAPNSTARTCSVWVLALQTLGPKSKFDGYWRRWMWKSCQCYWSERTGEIARKLEEQRDPPHSIW